MRREHRWPRDRRHRCASSIPRRHPARRRSASRSAARGATGDSAPPALPRGSRGRGGAFRSTGARPGSTRRPVATGRTRERSARSAPPTPAGRPRPRPAAAMFSEGSSGWVPFPQGPQRRSRRRRLGEAPSWSRLGRRGADRSRPRTRDRSPGSECSPPRSALRRRSPAPRTRSPSATPPPGRMWVAPALRPRARAAPAHSSRP